MSMFARPIDPFDDEGLVAMRSSAEAGRSALFRAGLGFGSLLVLLMAGLVPAAWNADDRPAGGAGPGLDPMVTGSIEASGAIGAGRTMISGPAAHANPGPACFGSASIPRFAGC